MARIALYLFACSMVVASVLAVRAPPPVSPTIRPFLHTLEEQCKSRGKLGACLAQNLVNGEVQCANLMCAHQFGQQTKPTEPGALFEARSSGPVDDGTLCATGKICLNGICQIGTPPSKPLLGSIFPRYNCFTPDAEPNNRPAQPAAVPSPGQNRRIRV